MAALLLPVVSAGSEADKAGGVELLAGCGEKVTELAVTAFGCWAVLPVKAAAARCLSLEILRGRGCKGDGAALRLPLAGPGDCWDWEPEEEGAGCWRPCW